MSQTHKNEALTDKKRNIRNDIILAAAIVIIAVAGLVFWMFNRTEGTYVAVKVDGEVRQMYSLSEDCEVVIKTGADNEHVNVLVIRDGKAFVKEADCPDSICVKTRAASYVGETIVCLPHKLVVEIVADGDVSDLDMTI